MFGQLKKRLADWLLYAETVHHLSWLNDHLLADMGLERRDIRRFAREAVSRSKAQTKSSVRWKVVTSTRPRSEIRSSGITTRANSECCI